MTPRPKASRTAHLAARFTEADRASGPSHDSVGHATWATGQAADARATPAGPGDAEGDGENGLNAAAVTAYHASIQSDAPLSERKLARMFGKTSSRWALNRMAEARQPPPQAVADSPA